MVKRVFGETRGGTLQQTQRVVMAPLLVVSEAKIEQRIGRRKRIEVQRGLAQFDRFVKAAEPKERLGLRLKAQAVAGVEGKRAIDLGRCLPVLGPREMGKADH